MAPDPEWEEVEAALRRDASSPCRGGDWCEPTEPCSSCFAKGIEAEIERLRERISRCECDTIHKRESVGRVAKVVRAKPSRADDVVWTEEDLAEVKAEGDALAREMGVEANDGD